MRTLAIVLLLATTTIAAEPVPILFDTDMDSDCDDLGALGMLHVLADRGEASILATVSSSRNEWTPGCIAAVNTYYGRPTLAIGRPAKGASKPSKYARELATKFPHKLGAIETVPDAMAVYREVLANAKDGSVVIVTVGYLTNIADLLKLPATATQPSGMDLVKAKVKVWVCMGGNFVGTPAKDDLKLGNNNFTFDKDGAHFAVHNWPGRLVFVGREIGSVPSGLKAGAKLKDLPVEHPVRAGYALWFGKEPQDRHVADQTTVLYAVRGLQNHWTLEEPGTMDLKPDMTFHWKPDAKARQGYLLKKPGQDRIVEGEISDLMTTLPKSAK